MSKTPKKDRAILYTTAVFERLDEVSSREVPAVGLDAD